MNRDELNARLARINVKGGEYVTVPQRVQGFWNACPDGRISVEWLVLERDFCVCRASIHVAGELVAQGTAFEERAQKGVNSTSFIENCETSAIGRALGVFGIGSVESIASAEEVAAAVQKQDADKARVNGQQKALAQARQKALQAGVTDAEMFEALQAEIPGKRTTEYSPSEAARAVQIIEGLVRK